MANKMYAYMVFLHSPETEGMPFAPGAPCKENPSIGYRFIFSPTPLGTPVEALGLYYSTIYGGTYTVAIHEFQFPADMTQETIVALNPHKSTGPLVLGGKPTDFQSLEEFCYAMGENSLKTKTHPERLVKYFQAESEFAMAEERRLAARALWQLRYEFGVGAAGQPTPVQRVCDRVMVFGGVQWLVPTKSPLAAILGTPFCPEVAVADIDAMPTALSTGTAILLLTDLKRVVENAEKAFPDVVAAAPICPATPTTRAHIITEAAKTFWTIFEEKVLYFHPPNVKAPLPVTKEALQFLWLYLTKGVRFNRLRDILETKGITFVREIPEWWGDVTTHLALVEFFKQKQLRSIYMLRPTFLADAISLCKNFFGEGWAEQHGLNWEALETILYRPQEIAEDEQNFLVRNFCRTVVTDASGETLGSASAHAEFLAWLTGKNSSAKSHLPEAIATEIISIMNVGVFGATMKRLGYTMKRRAQGNVYLDVAVRKNDAPAPPASVDDARTKILEEMAKTMDPKTANSAKHGGWFVSFASKLETSAMFDGMGSTGPYEPQYAEP